jgi:hypothetical protein
MFIVKLIDIKTCVKSPVTFAYYREKNLFYTTVNGDVFAVPIDDLGTASVNIQEKGLLLMRYMRKHNQVIQDAGL